MASEIDKENIDGHLGALTCKSLSQHSFSPLSSFISFSHSLSKPFNATRVNAADIENRVEMLKRRSQAEEANKGGFWEEFDVSRVFCSELLLVFSL